ncbi:MAG: hypothetical protein K8T89_07385 [Planctomycetes bacterium]|nr:hypothetical protein [Planctomycetota bacterium]
MRLGASSLGAFALQGDPSRTSAADAPAIAPFQRYADLLDLLKKRGHKFQVVGHAPDRSPLVVVRAGGDKKPGIFISAGSHSTEHAGVRTAVELLDQLKTKHQVYVYPCRDPIGLNGFNYALSMALGEDPALKSVEEAETLIRKQGDIHFDEGGALLTSIGEYGFATQGLLGRFKKGDKVLEPLLGRRIYYLTHSKDMPGSGPLERAYTLIVTPDGEVLHLNRFHDTSWAPIEVRCARRLMAEIQPGLTFDLHEYGGDAFWFSTRKQRTEQDEVWEQRMAREAIRAVGLSGVKLAAENYSPGASFSRLERGVYGLDATKRGEGLNLVDFAASKYGPGFTVETGMRQPFEQRVQMSMLTVKTAVKVFEERYA